jgi:cyclophilin family peptidyl-prolyl cis-trans isomerase
MSVTLHTTLGDIKIEVFCESVPKTAEVSEACILPRSTTPC